MAKTNTIRSNSLQTNSVRLNGVEGLRRVSLQAGEIPDIPPTYTLSASVANGVVSATLNGVVVSLPYTANEGDVIVVSVTPNDGYAFEGWNDGNTDNPRTITMNADVALSAQCVEVVQPPVGNYIQFEDAEVERVLMSKGVSSDGVGITMEDAAKVTNMQGWFKNNTAIRTFNELQYFTGLTTLSQDIFFGSSLEAVTFPVTMTAFGNYCFYQLAGMDTLEIPATITTIGTYLLSDSSIVKVIMRATTPPAIAGYTFRFHRGAVSIYVPDASLEAYKTATNWVDMAAYIHPLSEIEGNALGLVSDGNAYIVTDYYPNTYDNVEVEFESPSSSTIQLLLGSRESLSSKDLFLSATSSGGSGYVDRFYTNTTPAYTVTNGRNNIKLQLSSDDKGLLIKDSIILNGIATNTYTRAAEPTEYVMPYPLVVFGSNQMNSSAIDTRIFKGKIYFVKITDARSGEVKLYLQPRVVDGVAGMMDTISGTFYTNSNTKGTFIVE